MALKSSDEYLACRDRLSAKLRNWPEGTPVRLAKPTSNIFRHRTPNDAPGLDVSNLSGVMEIDGVNATADVAGMTTYEDLVDTTLPHGYMPKVVPQLKTITLGGAVTGLGIESSSFRNGFPHESVIEMEILTPTGEVVVARPDNEYSDLYRGFPNSYGTLGYALRLKISLERTKPFVRVDHIKHTDSKSFFSDMAERCSSGAHDFVDGTIFSTDEMYLSVASFEDNAPYTSDYTGMNIYYRSLQTRSVDHMRTLDYLWRWDTDWFWCSQNLGMQNPLVRRLVPSRYRRSDVYWKIRSWDAKLRLSKRVRAALKHNDQEAVIQDIEVSVDEAPEMLFFLDSEIDLKPVWVCPIRLGSTQDQWDLYPLDPSKLYVNFGFWGAVDLDPGEAPDVHNRMIEDEVSRLGGRKSLYSTAFYDKDEFWAQYNGDQYKRLKAKYDPDDRFLDLYAKAVGNR